MASGKDLRKALKINDLTMEEAAEKLGISRGTLYNNVNKEELESDFEQNVQDKLGIDLNNISVSFIEQRHLRKIEADPEREGITYVPISVQAGYSKKILDPMFKSSLQKLFVPGMPYRGENYRIWEVEGNSMEPTFKEGFSVLTEKVEGPWKKIKEYHAYVVVTEDDLYLKRLAYSKNKKDHWVMISDNEELYPQFLLPVNEVKELWLVKRKMDWEMSPPKRFDIKL